MIAAWMLYSSLISLLVVAAAALVEHALRLAGRPVRGVWAAAIALTLVLVLLGTTPRLARPLSLALGVGGLGYAAFWMWAGFRAPGLGSTGAAKESLKWLAMPSSGIFVLATATVALLILRASRQGRRMP